MGAGRVKDLGPCSVTFNGNDLGKTFGGVKFRYSEDGKPVNEDQAGSTDVDEIITGASCEVEVPLSRSSLSILSKVVGGGTYNGTKLTVSNRVGVSMYDLAKVLILKPIVNSVASTDATTWLTASKATPKVDFEIVYDNEGQRVYKVTFKVFPDESTGELFKIGE